MADAGEPVEIKIDTTNLHRAAQEAPALLFNHMRAAFRRILQKFNARHTSERMRGRPGLVQRTGALKRSFSWTVDGTDLNTLSGKYLTNSAYAATQEFGDPNKRPTKKRYLAIPLDAAKTAAGVSRFASPLLESQALSSAYPETFIARSKAGNLIIFGKLSPSIPGGKRRVAGYVKAATKAGNDPTIVPLFVLKPSVSIPARLGTRELWAQSEGDVIAEVVGAADAALTEAAQAGGAT